MLRIVTDARGPRETVPVFAAEAGGRFDLIVIHGGHDEATCRTDVLSCRAAAAPGALVIIDDLMPHQAESVGVAPAWEALLAEGVLVDPEIWCALQGANAPEANASEPPERCAPRWGIARYGAPSGSPPPARRARRRSSAWRPAAGADG